MKKYPLRTGVKNVQVFKYRAHVIEKVILLFNLKFSAALGFYLFSLYHIVC